MRNGAPDSSRYKIDRCLGHENVARALGEREVEGFIYLDMVFAGMAEVGVNSPLQSRRESLMMPVFILVTESIEYYIETEEEEPWLRG